MNQEKLQNSAAWSEESGRERKIFLFSLDVCNIVAVGLKAQLTRNIPQKVKLNAKSIAGDVEKAGICIWSDYGGGFINH